MSSNKFNVLLDNDSDNEVAECSTEENVVDINENNSKENGNDNPKSDNINNTPNNNINDNSFNNCNNNNNDKSFNNSNNNNNNNNFNNNNNNINKIENDIFQKYYKKQPITYDKQYFSKKTTLNNDSNGFQQKTYKKSNYYQDSSNKYHTPENQENKNLTITNRPFDLQNTLQQPLKILAHHVIDITKWELSNFHYVTTLTKWEQIPSFCKALKYEKGVSSLVDYDLYMMKEHITPLWENQWNKNGSICSVRIDSLPDAINLIQKLVTHMANNSLLNNLNQTTTIQTSFRTGLIGNKTSDNSCSKEVNIIDSFQNVNGISFTPKKISVLSSQQVNYYLIKIWLRVNYSNQTPEKLLCEDVFNTIRKLSVKITPIKAEY